MNIIASRNRDSDAVETYIPDTETAFDERLYIGEISHKKLSQCQAQSRFAGR